MELQKVSAQTGIPAEVLAMYECGERRPTATEIIALATLYAVDLGELFPQSLSQITGQLH